MLITYNHNRYLTHHWYINENANRETVTGKYRCSNGDNYKGIICMSS